MALQTEEPRLDDPTLKVEPPASRPSPASAAGAAEREQARFEWSLIAAGLAGLMAVIALIVGFAALSQNATQTTVLRTVYSGRAAAPAAPGVAPQYVSMAFRSDTEHGKRGPDGKWHDAATPANFTVHAGAMVTVMAMNYDTSPHSFTASDLGIDVLIPAAGSPSSPAMVTFKFHAPSKPGRYLWHCKLPCDPFAMVHIGYMLGYVTVKA